MGRLLARTACVALLTLFTPQARAQVTVPFVGCESGGQTGDQAAPSGNPVKVRIAPAKALRLAYYSYTDGFGVLAPRGWHCFAIVGSGGIDLFVTPGPLGTADVFSQARSSLSGLLVELGMRSGETSGRDAVAEVIARVFPSRMNFVRGVEKLYPESYRQLTVGPFPKDHLKYKSRTKVEYRTPPGTEGLASTLWWLKTGDLPITGEVILTGSAPNLVHVATRLAPADADLVGAILADVERNAPRIGQ